MDEIEEVQQHNMISNLPLLFANGYPTSLEKITESQLENFIPFMVQCSLGHINLQGKIDYSEPEWWPENVPYSIPFIKPKKFTGNWLEKMKEIVIICYQFHKSVFLLRFCNDLAAYEHASLRFINNYNSTTSLFDRRSNKLLVTFRNENMSYDQPQRSRKCLLQQKSKINSQQQHMVEPAPFDIYLCDNCDAELYSEEAIVEHEKTCNLDDDVIICDSPEPSEDNQLNLPLNTTENNELRIGFLLNFNLQSRDCSHTAKDLSTSAPNNGSNTTKDAKDTAAPLEKLKRLPRRNRAVHSLSRCPTIPLSSPAGQLLIKTSKTLMTQDYLMERLDRMERFCYAPILCRGTIKPKFLDKKYTSPVSHCTFKKPQDYTIHTYIFPRRQFSQRQRTENFMFLNSLLIKRCRPISVRLRKITDNDIVQRKRSNHSNKLNIKLTRDTSRSSNWKISSPSAEIIVDTIDLCSSDEEAEHHHHNHHHQQQQQQQQQQHLQQQCRILDSSCSNSNTMSPALKLQIQKIAQRLNSEITLTPIAKHNPSTTPQQSPTVVAPATSTTNSKINLLTNRLAAKGDQKPLSLNRYEGNIVMSPTQNGTVGTTTKPLQPSVFIFSNYTTKPLSINSFLSTATGATTPTAINNNNELIVSSSYQNEENHHESSSKKNASVAEWCPASIAVANNNSISSTHNNSSNSANRTVGVSERNSRSLPLMQFGSAGRIVSIDLTS